jgi:hypothetical protein
MSGNVGLYECIGVFEAYDLQVDPINRFCKSLCRGIVSLIQKNREGLDRTSYPKTKLSYDDTVIHDLENVIELTEEQNITSEKLEDIYQYINEQEIREFIDSHRFLEEPLKIADQLLRSILCNEYRKPTIEFYHDPEEGFDLILATVDHNLSIIDSISKYREFSRKWIEHGFNKGEYRLLSISF